MNFCSSCGKSIDSNTKFCPNCGQSQIVMNSQKIVNQSLQNKNISSEKQIIIGVVGACSIIVITVVILLFNNKSKVYFSDDNNITSNEIAVEENKTTTVAGQTTVKYDNVYVLNTNTTESTVIAKIVEDSESQKKNCPKDIIEIEKRIVSNYEIDSINLCEMDKNFALELEKVIKYIYNEFPTAQGHLSHISLGNLGIKNNAIAFFQWYASFTTSSIDVYTGYKSKIILNTKYYLNEALFDSSMINSVANRFNPANANKYSILAHEFGHYLSFIAANNYYGANPTNVFKNDYNSVEWQAIVDFNQGKTSLKMIQEAYNNYKEKNNSTLQFDEFRGTISDYALAKDNYGNYIYDETIAEAFHDYYLNGDKAVDASKEIVVVLRKYLEM